MIDKHLSKHLQEVEKTPAVAAQAVAIVIRTAQQAIEATGLTVSDLERLQDYWRQQDSVGAILDPTAWIRRDEAMEAEVRERARLVRAMMGLTVAGNAGLLDAFFTAAIAGDGIKTYIVAPMVDESETV